MRDPAAFRFRHPVPVRFRDVDAMGHAHHAEALIYFEEARWAYWKEVVGHCSVERIEYVMAEATVRWSARVLWPQTVQVGVRVSGLGRKHFDMEYRVEGADGALLVSGRSRQVMYDLEAERSVPVPDELARRLTSFDGPFADS